MTSRNSNRSLQFVSIAIVVLALLALRVFDPGIFATLRGSGFDMLQRLYPRQMDEPQPVRIVDIDEASLRNSLMSCMA
jgi:CHASE2 domain-containing sensor protein